MSLNPLSSTITVPCALASLSTGDKIALVTLVLVFVGTVRALAVVPEVRQFVARIAGRKSGQGGRRIGRHSKSLERPTEVSVAASAEELRSQHGLRALLPEEDDLPVDRLPSGFYGFTVPWALRDLDALSKERGGTFVLEIHKLDSGLRAVGFLSHDDLIRLRDPGRGHDLELTLSMAPTLTRPSAISLPITTVQKARDRQIEGIRVIDTVVE